MRAPLAFAFSVAAACAAREEPAPRDAGPPAAVVVVVADAAPAVDVTARLHDVRQLAQRQRWHEARAAAREAASGGDLAALAELAYVAAYAGDADAAEAAARDVIDRSTSAAVRARAYHHLGIAAELRGDEAAAREAFERSLRLADNPVVADRLAKLAPRPATPVPPTPPCAAPRPADEVCACLAAELAMPGRCVESHQHGGDAWAVTLVARDAAPTYLVTGARGQARVLAAIGPTRGAETTITRWNVLPGPEGASLVRVDARTSLGREDAILCVTGAGARCLAVFPVEDPAVKRRLEVTVEEGVAHVTVVEGAPHPTAILGPHRLW